MTEPAINPFDLDSQERAQDERARASRNEARAEADDIKWMVSGKRGRRIMWGLLDRAGVFRSSFNSSDSVTAFNEGQRNIGLIYLSLITAHAPAAYATMVEENRVKA